MSKMVLRVMSFLEQRVPTKEQIAAEVERKRQYARKLIEQKSKQSPPPRLSQLKVPPPKKVKRRAIRKKMKRFTEFDKAVSDLRLADIPPDFRLRFANDYHVVPESCRNRVQAFREWFKHRLQHVAAMEKKRRRGAKQQPRNFRKYQEDIERQKRIALIHRHQSERLKEHRSTEKQPANRNLSDEYNRCIKCGATSRLHVHHKTYARFTNENAKTDLEIQCHDCHEKTHGRKIGGSDGR